MEYTISLEESKKLTALCSPLSGDKDLIMQINFNIPDKAGKLWNRGYLVSASSQLQFSIDVETSSKELETLYVNAKDFVSNLAALNSFETPVKIVTSEKSVDLITSNAKVTLMKPAAEAKEYTKPALGGAVVDVIVDPASMVSALNKGGFLFGSQPASNIVTLVVNYVNNIIKVYSNNGNSMAQSSFPFAVTSNNGRAEKAEENRKALAGEISEYSVSVPIGMIPLVKEVLADSKQATVFIDGKNLNILSNNSILTVALAKNTPSFYKTVVEGTFSKLGTAASAKLETVNLEKAANILMLGNDKEKCTVEIIEKAMILNNGKTVKLEAETDGTESVTLSLKLLREACRGDKEVTVSILESMEKGGKEVNVISVDSENKKVYLMPVSDDKDAESDKKESKKAESKKAKAAEPVKTVEVAEEVTEEETAEEIAEETAEEVPFDESSEE